MGKTIIVLKLLRLSSYGASGEYICACKNKIFYNIVTTAH